MGVKTLLVSIAITMGILFACVGIGYHYGYQSRDQLVVRDQLAESKVQKERQIAQQEIAQTVLDGLSNWKQNTRTIVEKTYNEKTNPVFINVCATDESVSLFNSVVAAAETSLSSRVDAKVPVK